MSEHDMKILFFWKVPCKYSKEYIDQRKRLKIIVVYHCNNATVWKRCFGKMFFSLEGHQILLCGFFSLLRITGLSELHLEKYKEYQENLLREEHIEYLLKWPYVWTSGTLSRKNLFWPSVNSLQRVVWSHMFGSEGAKNCTKVPQTVAMFGFSTTTLTERL